MDGVTIIRECSEISSTVDEIMIIVTMIAGALAIGIIEIVEKLVRNKAIKVIAPVLSITLLIIFLIISYFILAHMDRFQEPNGKYEVTVSSNVDMNEFQSRYEIIDFDNGVYTVKPKDNVPQQPISAQEENTEEVTTEINGKIYKIIPIE